MSQTRDAVIVSSVRTAVGKAFKGTLRAARPDDLAATAIRGALSRVPVSTRARLKTSFSAARNLRRSRE